jgi:hypothetical protein
MKVVQRAEGHNFHVDWHFKFWEEKGKKLGQLAVPHVHRTMASFKVCQQFVKKIRREKTLEPL